MTSLVVVTHEPIADRMTGPAIRCWELARVLAQTVSVTLAMPEAPVVPATEVPIATYRYDAPHSLVSIARNADAILISGYLLQAFPDLARLDGAIIVDVYDPFPVENLDLYRRRPLANQVELSQHDFRVLTDLLRVGDFFVCGSERQRTFWLGMLAAAGRINPRTHATDPSFRRLIDVVSMGLPDSPPDPGDARTKGVFPGIGVGDFLVVWPGGIWDWLDPVTAIEAMRLIEGTAPDVKLLFPGFRHPRPEIVGPMAVQDETLRRSEELGLLERSVFFNDGWTPYAQRAAYLCDADLALSLHRDGLEVHLAVRARLLDCIWAGTPVIATRGDVLAEEMDRYGLATLIAPGDATALAEAILEWRGKRGTRVELASRFRALSEEHRWSVAARPLVEYLRAPGRSSDREACAVSTSEPLPRGGWTPPAAVAGRWQTDEVLDLPFDQYQRHRQAAQIVEALRGSADRGVRILDVGSGPAVTRRFFGPDDIVVSLDLKCQHGPLAVVGDATRLPFADDSFDFCVTLDAIEHLPDHHRPRMIDECIRVSRRGFILIAPTASPEALAAEHLLFEFIRLVLHAEHPSLREHLQNGLPGRAGIEAQLQRLGCRYLVRPSGYIHRWLAMMLLKHHVQTFPNNGALHHQIDNYYNRYFFEADQRAPSYRTLFFVAKPGAPTDLEQVARALEVPEVKAPPGDDARALGQLGLLVDLFTLRSLVSGGEVQEALRRAQDAQGELQQRVDSLERSQSESGQRVALLEQSLEETQRWLTERERELRDAHDLLERIARGKVMRAMNGIQAVARRLRA